MNRNLIRGMIPLIIIFLVLFIAGCGKSSSPSQNETERTEYCTKLCGGLYTHDPCANDCMAGVESNYTKPRNFTSMTSNELNETCTLMCGTPKYVGDPCTDNCIAEHNL